VLPEPAPSLRQPLPPRRLPWLLGRCKGKGLFRRGVVPVLPIRSAANEGDNGFLLNVDENKKKKKKNFFY
jgi:hypothetical protein